ncbi:MAG: hypothetical protein ABSC54_03290 [Smithellaceae bacterium]
MLLPIIVAAPIVEGKAMLEQHNLINLFSKEWEERCRIAANKYSQLDHKKITEPEKWWRVKQLLKEMILKERRKAVRPSKNNIVPVVERGALAERRKEMDFHSKEWTDRCKAIAEKCEQLDNMKISKDEKLRRTKQLLKELAFTDTKR